MTTKIKNLEAHLDKATTTYDNTIGANNQLRTKINMLRREKKNYIDMEKSLREQIEEAETLLNDKTNEV